MKKSENANNAADGSVESSDLLAGDELEVMDGLVAAWNAFVKIETLHPDETEEFRRAIHAAQHIIMSRPVQRQFNSANK